MDKAKYIKEPNYKYIKGDSEKILDEYSSHSIKLIITSPPYNLGKEYETDKSIEKYLEKQRLIIKKLEKILADDGSICWQVGNYVENGEVFPLDTFYYRIFKDFGFKLRNRIVWHFGHGLHSRHRFSGRYETILWFTKSDDYIFNLDPVRVPAKYPGKRHYKGPNKGELSGNPQGKNPSDIWQTVLRDWEKEVWNIPNVKANHVEKTNHPCQFPVELIERCVLALTNEDDWVLDPYAGVGTSIIASLKHKRKAIGIEKYKKYINIGEDRIQKLIDGELKIRPLTRDVYNPQKSKLSQVPIEFQNNKGNNS